MSRAASVARTLPAILFLAFISWVIFASDRGTCEVCTHVKALPLGDRAGHVILYGVLVFLVGIARRWQVGTWRGIRLLNSSSVLAVMITLEEVSQLFFTTRTGDAGDLVASWIGIFLGDWCARLVHLRVKNPR